jgi:hypothetical protein
MNLEADKTQRGFVKVIFEDHYDNPCSIQESSMAFPGAIWLGFEESNPRHLIPGKGWAPYEFPEGVEVMMNTRMHLTQAQVKSLIPVLQHFEKTSYLPPVEDGILMTQANRWKLARREFGSTKWTFGLMGLGWLLGAAASQLVIAHMQFIGVN